MNAYKYDPKNIELEKVDWNEELKLYKYEQEEELIIDFDQAVKEERARAIQVKFSGRKFSLPASAPAWIIVFVNRHGEGDNLVLSDKHTLELIEGLMGKEFVSAITDEKENFVTLEAVNTYILEPVFKKWGFASAEAGSKKKQMTRGSSIGRGAI